MTFEENIQAQWQATYVGCDPAVENNPQQYSLGWFRQGYLLGLKAGQQIGQQVYTDDAKREWDSTWNIGHKQGLVKAAFLASNVALNCTYSDDIMQGAALMRELIVLQLEEAATE